MGGIQPFFKDVVKRRLINFSLLEIFVFIYRRARFCKVKKDIFALEFYQEQHIADAFYAVYLFKFRQKGRYLDQMRVFHNLALAKFSAVLDTRSKNHTKKGALDRIYLHKRPVHHVFVSFVTALKIPFKPRFFSVI